MCLILGNNHILRYCKRSTLDNGIPSAAAFILRKNKNEESLSVDWLEHIKGIFRNNDIQQILKIYKNRNFDVN